MDIYPFARLLKQLPDCESFPTKELLPEGVFRGQLIKEFIPPYLSVTEGEPDNSQVLIVSAPGAVGKSTLARAISANKKALIWDLSSADEIGSGSLDAMLEYVMEQGWKEDFREWMAEGLQFVIIDALDEGRIKVTESAFIRLLENIERLAKESKGVCFVLLGRTQVAEWVWLMLAESNKISTSLLTIDPFDRNQAVEYIDERIVSDRRTTVFEECRNLLFDRLAFSVSENIIHDVSKEFLHYPPVLDVIVELLDGDSNLSRLKNDLTSGSIELHSEALALLQKVIIRILERERQEKFLPAIKSTLHEKASQYKWNDWDSLYTPHEQCKRLSGRMLNMTIGATPDTLPEGMKTDYEELVQGWLDEHPFLQGRDRAANAVFQSYLYAISLRGDLASEIQRRVTIDLLNLKNLRLRTRLLAEFYLNTESETFDTLRRITPEHLGILYDSLLSSESDRGYLRLTVDGLSPFEGELKEDTQIAEGEFEFIAVDSEGELQAPSQSIAFLLEVGTGSVLSFSRSVRDISVSVPCAVEFGVNSPEFQFGPAVYVSAGLIRIGSESLVVGGRTRSSHNDGDEANVVLEAMEFEASSLTNRPTVYDSERFCVSWPGAERYPWTDFMTERPSETFKDDAALHDTYIRFKRIATTLRSQGKGSLARAKVKIEHSRILQGALGHRLLACLVSDGILELKDGGRRYFWDQSRASTHLGVTWGNLRKGECPQTLTTYLSKFVQENPDLFLR